MTDHTNSSSFSLQPASAVRRDHSQVRRIAAGAELEGLFSIALISSLLCIAGISVSGRPGLVLSSLGTLGFGYLAVFIGRRVLPESIVFVVLISVYCSQIAFQVLIAALDIPSLGGNGFDIYANIGALTVGQLCLLAGSLLAACSLSALFPTRRSAAGFLMDKLSVRMEIYLVIALIGVVLRTVLPSMLTGLGLYLFLILTASLAVTVFFVGWFRGDMGIVGTYCLILIIADAIAGGLTGQRFGFVVLGMYMVGRLVSPLERNRRIIALCSALLLMPLLLLGSAIGEVRSVTGRGSVKLIKMSTLTLLAQTVVQDASPGNLQAANLAVLSRFYAWPNAAVAELTPEEVPYRGYGEWLSEWKYYYNPNMGGDTYYFEDRRYQAGVGTYHDPDYGFDSFPGSWAEFGTLADGWSTGGGWGVVWMSFLVAIGLCGAERAAAHMGLGSAGTLLFTCVLCWISWLAYTGPAQNILKAVLTQSVMWPIIIKCFDATLNHFIGRQRLDAPCGTKC